MADSLWSSVVAASHFEGTNGSTSFVDEKGHAFTRIGSAAISTAVAKFGSSSLYVQNASGLALPYQATQLAGDFTVEAFVYLTNTATYNWLGLFGFGNSTGGPSVLVSANTGPFLVLYDGGIKITAGEFTKNAWHHVAITRQSGVIRLFLDGVVGGSTYSSAAVYAQNYLTVGCVTTAGGEPMGLGYIDELRVTNGTARYTANFTPPTAAFEQGVPAETIELSGAYTTSGSCLVEGVVTPTYVAPSSDGAANFDGSSAAYTGAPDAMRVTFTGGHIELVASGQYRVGGSAILYVPKPAKVVSAKGAFFHYKPGGSMQVAVTTKVALSGKYTPREPLHEYPFVDDNLVVAHRPRVTRGVKQENL